MKLISKFGLYVCLKSSFQSHPDYYLDIILIAISNQYGVYFQLRFRSK